MLFPVNKWGKFHKVHPMFHFILNRFVNSTSQGLAKQSRVIPFKLLRLLFIELILFNSVYDVLL